LALVNEYVGDITIPTQVIKYNQNFHQADQSIRLQYSNQIKLYMNIVYTFQKALRGLLSLICPKPGYILNTITNHKYINALLIKL
jgi:hypothetical protein